MSPYPAPENGAQLSHRYQSLLALTESISSHTNLSALFKEILDQLRPVVDFDAVAVALYDAERDLMRLHVFEASIPLQHAPSTGEGGPVEASPEGVVWRTQKPMLISPVDQETRFPEYIARIQAEKIQTLYSIPLTSSERRLGSIAFGSRRVNAYLEGDLEFLEKVAKQVAVAVDNVLNFQSAASARDRNQLLLEVGQAVVSHLNLSDLFRAVSSCLRRFINHDAASIVLVDEKTGQLRVHTLDRAPAGVLDEGTVLPMDGTPPGLCIKTQATVLRERIDLEEFYVPQMRMAYGAGLRCGCSVLLKSHDRILGTINVGSFHEAAFTKDDARLLEQIAAQVAIAVENALNFERADRERARAETLLEINNAITTNLDLHELIRATSQCLRGYFNQDFAGMALYDEETNQLMVHSLNSSRPDEYLIKGARFPIEGTLNGLAFSSRQPVVRGRIDPSESSWPLAQKFFEEQGLKSGCFIPMIWGGRTVGVLSLGSSREYAFREDDVELLVNIAGQVALAVENTLQYRQIESLKNKLASEKLYLEEEIKTQYNFAEIVGQSSALLEVLHQVETVAPTDSTVLLCGETGTGKELIARAIHNLSARNEHTLVKLNCAAIPTGLLESELFGHEKGAFTGAITPRVGRFELAHKGTLLLDEIGEIPLELQPKLLRVLQEHEFERLGSSRTIKTDARLIAATNCDLAQMVDEKKFRRDLFYRLNVFPIMIPPLRERTGDIPLLVGYFAQKHAARMNKKIQIVPAATMESLCSYHWPGNVRELENFIERSVILSSGLELQSPLKELFPSAALSADGNSRPSKPKLTTMDEMERAYIEEVLRHTTGSIAGKGGAAEILGMPASTLRSRMKKLGIR